MRVLVIGYGNPLRSDDALGWRVAEALRSRFEHQFSHTQARVGAGSADVEVISCQQLNPELADPISRADLVLFVDAADPAANTMATGSGSRVGVQPDPVPALLRAIPGSILEHDLEPTCQSPQCFSHDLTPSTLLACAGELFGSCPKGKLLSVVGDNFGMGEVLSPTVEAALAELLRRIEVLIDDAFSTSQPQIR
ncbi:MAG TPA: hydrogenase maturation protease [Terriglobales bacterium]|nr:hydrogenase maturation protease [Terriglobales bacterium]